MAWIDRIDRLPEEEDGPLVLIYAQDLGHQILPVSSARAILEEEYMGTTHWQRLTIPTKEKENV
jgi:hypothetical protein